MSQDVQTYKALAAGLLRNPDDSRYLVDQFAHLFNTTDRGRVAQYLPLARRAWRNEPEKFSVALNYAIALVASGEFHEGIRVCKWCVDHAPDDDWLTRSYHQLGIAYRSNDNDAEAIEWYSKAIERNNSPEIKKDRALALLSAGKLYEGLKEFEIRRECVEAGIRAESKKANVVGRLPDHVLHWQGQDLVGKTIVVYAEEGIGDFFMVCRFIPLLRKFGPAKILLTGKVPDVLDLVADNIDVDGIVELEQFECDYVIGSMSLPWRLGLDYKDVSGAPYFQARPATFPRRGLLNVGLVWRGNPVYGRNSHRSMDFANFTPLFEIPDVAFYSLQVGDVGREVTALGYDGFVADLAPFAKSWRKTARLIANLDAIVTVDTACAHLAGALGVPAFVLVTKFCDWRWTKHSTRTVWYDSLRIIRQNKQGNWAHVVSRARIELEGMANERRSQTRSDQPGPASGSARRTAEDRRRAGKGRAGQASVAVQG